jgi:hypothetical protein
MSNTSRFNADEFLNMMHEEALDTERTLFPQGEVVAASIETLKVIPPKPFEDKATGEQKLGSPQVEIHFNIREDHAERIRAELGYASDKPVRFIWRGYLDVNETTGHLEFGPNKNIFIGQLRAAAGQNEPGVPWAFAHLREARNIAFTVKHEEWERDGRKGVAERVGKFAAAAEIA